MKQNDKIVIFQEKNVRRVWNDEEWWYNLVDVIEVLTDSPEPRKYWSKLKKKMTDEGVSELSPIWRQLPFIAVNGKTYKMDASNRHLLFRIIQSIPSPKAEPFKMWLAQVAEEHIQEIENPEIGFDRLKELYKAKGYPDEWIEQRLKSIDIRKQLTDEWKSRGVKEGSEYSILTAEIAKATFGVTPSQHARIKGLEKENLRDHMTDLELVFTMLGEVITKNLAENDNAKGFDENRDVAQRGGGYAGTARRNLEKKENLKVVSAKNFLDIKKAEDPDELSEATD